MSAIRHPFFASLILVFSLCVPCLHAQNNSHLAAMVAKIDHDRILKLADGHGKDVMHWDDWPVRQPCLFFAYAETGNEKYLNLWKKLDADPASLEVRRNMAVTQ